MALLFLLSQPGLLKIVYALLLVHSTSTLNHCPRSVKENNCYSSLLGTLILSYHDFKKTKRLVHTDLGNFPLIKV